MEIVRLLISAGMVLGIPNLSLAQQSPPIAKPKWLHSIPFGTSTALSLHAAAIPGQIREVDYLGITHSVTSIGLISYNYRNNVEGKQSGQQHRSENHTKKIRALGKLNSLFSASEMMMNVVTGEVNLLDTAQAGTQAIVSIAAGGATAAAMFGIAATFGVASTGTAIGSLSGAAFTSSALAWWGGGAVSAGGGGVAVGAYVVTGGVVIVGIAASYGVLKLWDMYDPAELDGFNMLTNKLLERKDFTDRSTSAGVTILRHAEWIEEYKRNRKK